MKYSHMKLFFHFFVSACLSLLLVAFMAAPVKSADIRQPDGETLKVHVLMFVVDIDEIKSASQSFDANVYIQLRWKDPQLAHKGSKPVVKALKEVWNPGVLFVNQQKLWKTLPEIVTIAPDGEVFYRQRVWGAFSQPLKLKNFPFDRQVFSIQLVSSAITRKKVEFLLDSNFKSGIAQELSLSDWDVLRWTAETRDYKPMPTVKAVPGFAFSFETKRRTGYFIIKVIIPLILIVTMSWIVFWMDPREAGTQISVSITTMLTLIAYRFAIDASLPKVSYLTRLDYFILLSTILVYATLIDAVLTSTLAKGGKLSQAQAIDRWMRILFPSAFVIVAVKSLIF